MLDAGDRCTEEFALFCLFWAASIDLREEKRAQV